MTALILTGVFPVLPTIFDAGGALDEDGFRRVVDFVVACGADGVVFPGLASEYDQLTLDERLHLIAVVGEQLRGRAAFVVGAGGRTDGESAALAAAGAAAGASGAMVMTPARLGRDIAALAAFYGELARAGDLRIMLQNAPAPMGSNLSADEVAGVVEAAPAIAWVKEENQPGGQRISAILSASPGLAGVFGGAGGRYITDELARGASGTMPAAELPEAHVALYRAHRRGDAGRVRETYEAMLPLLMMQAVFRWNLTKEVLRRRGLIAHGFVRAAGPRLDADDHRELDRTLARLEPLMLADTVAA